jgi:hypothetical protein
MPVLLPLPREREQEAEQEYSVLVDRLEGFLCGLLS